MTDRTLPILSIDAWRNTEGDWGWNAWYKRGQFPADGIDWSTRKILAWFRDEGFLSDYSKGRLAVDDDQYNLVIVDRRTREPLFAIEYGGAQ